MTTPRIAAICATPRFENVGMRCVNHALKRLIERSGVEMEADFFCFDLPDDLLSSSDGIRYRTVLDLDPARYSLLIIWGDFLLNRAWVDGMIARLARTGLEAAEVRRKLYERLFYQAGGKPPRVIVFGQALLLDPLEVFDDTEYVDRLRALFRSAMIVSVRDPISAWRASALTGVAPGQFCGCDAALLLEPLGNDKDVVQGDSAAKEVVGVFFGRVHGAYGTHLALALALRRHARGLRAFWIPWLPQRPMPRWQAKAYGIRGRLELHSVEDYVEAVRSCRLVLTDSYHLAVVAWSHGVPAICIGRGARYFTDSRGDKKKEWFFSSNMLDAFYLFAEQGLRNLASGAARRAVAGALKPGAGLAVRRRLHALSSEHLRVLTAAIRQHVPSE